MNINDMILNGKRKLATIGIAVAVALLSGAILFSCAGNLSAGETGAGHAVSTVLRPPKVLTYPIQVTEIAKTLLLISKETVKTHLSIASLLKSRANTLKREIPYSLTIQMSGPAMEPMKAIRPAVCPPRHRARLRRNG